MDILVREKTLHHQPAQPGEARVWGLVGAAIVLGLLLLVGGFERKEHVQVASNDPVAVRAAPAPLAESIIP